MPTIKTSQALIVFSFTASIAASRNMFMCNGDKMICKFWLEPIYLGKNGGFSPKELNVIRKLIETHLPNILEAWYEHCG